MTHICVGKLTIIWTNAGILLIRPLGTNSEFLVEILIFSFTIMRLKVSSAKRRQFCLGPNELLKRFKIKYIPCISRVFRDITRQWKGHIKWASINCHCQSLSISVHYKPILLTHWGRNKMEVISQTTFLNAFSRMKMLEYRLKFHWSLFLGVQWTISQYWFR